MTYDPDFKRHVLSEYAIESRRFERACREGNLSLAFAARDRAIALERVILLWGFEHGTEEAARP